MAGNEAQPSPGRSDEAARPVGEAVRQAPYGPPRHVAVAGGAGYIGSHMCKALADAGHRVTVIDDFSSGHRDAVQWGELRECSLADACALGAVFGAGRFDAVVHLAGHIAVGESVAEPLRYYRNNVAATLTLLDTMRAHGVQRLVFSSTAAIFGEPRQDAIDETHPVAPISPYGHSKAMVEQMLRDCAAAWGLRAIALRYFNAAGADASGLIGEAHEPETHLIPRLLRLAAGRDPDVTLYGTDHPTPDGTCIRDYVHVGDLCDAHLLALLRLDTQAGFDAFNLGNGRGFSVLEVVQAVGAVTGHALRPSLGPRRAGDPARLVACPERAKRELGWRPRYESLEAIVASAWNWERRRRY